MFDLGEHGEHLSTLLKAGACRLHEQGALEDAVSLAAAFALAGILALATAVTGAAAALALAGIHSFTVMLVERRRSGAGAELRLNKRLLDGLRPGEGRGGDMHGGAGNQTTHGSGSDHHFCGLHGNTFQKECEEKRVVE